MIVDVEGHKIIIKESENLKNYQKSQLNYWGFKREGMEYATNSSKIGDVLFKLRNYFIKEGVPCVMSDSCMGILDEYITGHGRVKDIVDMARKYKNGAYSEGGLSDLNDFLRNNYPRKLKNHQIKAAQHLYLVRNGANFSVPGSGKTTVVLSVYEKLRLEGKVNTLFVIGPPACFQPWRDEFRANLGRNSNARVLAGGDPSTRKSIYFGAPNQKVELILTTFQTLLQDQNEVITFMKRSGVEIFLVIDEAHYIKQINGSWAKAVIGISDYAKFRCILTGTPMPRSYSDIYNLFDFLWLNNCPLDSKSKIRIQQLEEKKDEEAIKEVLDNTIGPLFYRVRKNDLGLRPPIFHEPLIVKMNKYEKRLYDAIENRVIEFSKGDYLRNIEVVKILRRGRMIRLRQCTSYAKLIRTVLENYNEDLVGSDSDLIQIINNYDDLEFPAKMERILLLAKEMKKDNRKIIIWSNFVDTINYLSKILLKNGVYCKKIYGATPVEQTTITEEETREKIRQEFIDPNSGLDVIIANPAACSESISLHTTCHSAIYYDLSYNCAQYLQSLDRIHRVGGSEIVDTHYYFLQYENTVDQAIIKNLNEKAEKMNNIIDEDCAVYNLDMAESGDDDLILKNYLESRDK